MKKYELHKCRFIIFFIIFVLSFHHISFDIFNIFSLVFIFSLITSFAYMIKTIMLLKKEINDDFYKLCFYLLSGASAYCCFNLIKIIVGCIISPNDILLLYMIKNLIFLAFLVYFAILSYRKIK